MKKNNNKTQLKKNRKTQVFLVFLVLSTILWAISKLSKEYTHTVKVKTNFINFTNDKELQNKPKDYLELVLKTSGFNLIGYSFLNKQINIDLSKLQKKKNRYYYYLTNTNISSLQSQLTNEEIILHVYPDTLFFDFGKLKSKNIAVNSKLKMNFKTGYDVVGKIDIKPKTIKISGTEQQINNIESINTKLFELNNIVDNFEYKIALDIPKEYYKIHFSAKEVTIKGVVEKFTESSLDIPFKVVNVPKGYHVETFIDKVEVRFKISLENYDKIQLSNFKIICDFNDVKDSKSTFLIPQIIRKPNLVSNVKLSQKKIEFLIKK